MTSLTIAMVLLAKPSLTIDKVLPAKPSLTIDMFLTVYIVNDQSD